MNQDKAHAPEILREERGSFGVITLNRPQALNALSYNMILELRRALDVLRANERVKTILFIGAGERAFCAGGDIKAAYHTGLAHKTDPSAPSPVDFFRDEYALNAQLFHYPKPLVALMNGITMGGGYGVAGNCKYRVACEKTLFAMPEVGIGFFPDVGSAYHLARAKGAFGHYIALTGNTVSGADMFYAGLADYYVSCERHTELIAALENGEPASVLKKFHAPPKEKSFFEENEKEIARIFASGDPEKILNEFSDHNICAVMKTRSPLSMKISARHLKNATGRSFDDSIAEDFILARNCMAGHEIYEGIRAQLIDKDKNPKWIPARLEEADEAMVDAFFRAEADSLENKGLAARG